MLIGYAVETDEHRSRFNPLIAIVTAIMKRIFSPTNHVEADRVSR